MKPLVTLVTGIALMTTMIAPALAETNDHRFHKSVEAALQKLQHDCQAIHDALEIAEDQANAAAGTPAAAQPAKDADKAWAAGQKKGCAWAS